MPIPKIFQLIIDYYKAKELEDGSGKKMPKNTGKAREDVTRKY
jgi:hypothetical protein